MVPRRMLIDIDEFGIELANTNRKRGVAPVGIRIRHKGNYVKEQKLTVIVAVEPGDPRLPAGAYGSIGRPRIWVKVSYGAGTTASDFADFLEDDIIDELENNPLPGQGNMPRIFIWNNLTAHQTPVVHNAVTLRPHGRFQIIARPPYRPEDGPIEYIIHQIVMAVEKREMDCTDTPALKRVIEMVTPQITGVDETFHKCGYIWT